MIWHGLDRRLIVWPFKLGVIVGCEESLTTSNHGQELCHERCASTNMGKIRSATCAKKTSASPQAKLCELALGIPRYPSTAVTWRCRLILPNNFVIASIRYFSSPRTLREHVTSSNFSATNWADGGLDQRHCQLSEPCPLFSRATVTLARVACLVAVCPAGHVSVFLP